MSNTNIFNDPVGLLYRGAIVSYDDVRHTIKVKLNNANSTSSNAPITIPAPQSLFYNNGFFIGSRPISGTPIVLGQGSGGQYYFISFLVENTPLLPILKSDELLIRSNENTFISLNLSNDINIGSSEVRTHYSTSKKYISSNFKENFSFTQASRKVEGLIRRDLSINNNFDYNTKLEDDNYHSKYFVISLDPSTTHNPSISSDKKNPGRVEQREIIYELEYDSDIEDDLTESKIYLASNNTADEEQYFLPNRRKSRADSFSLSLVHPNHLIEKIVGTGVDIFGNILDINRSPIPIGKNNATLQSDKNSDKQKSYLEIKELDRKSLAFHFEINVRKDLFENGINVIPDINSNEDYSRKRSRLFIDIDKEGQLKINIPSSSETGNIPLLTRYENYSTYGEEDNKNPNKIVFREDKLDIFHDSFTAPRATPTTDGFSFASARGSIPIKNGDLNAAPIDRITNEHLMWGTAYHDILNTCFVHQNKDFLNYQNGAISPLTVNLDDIPLINNLFTSEIKVSGDDANAGGRSGQLSFDGSLELNLGANTSDRHSLIIDTAGGTVFNIGRDLRNRSLLGTFNGDVNLQVGGWGVSGDSRFVKQNNGNIGAVFDLRIMTSGGFTHILRFDDTGMTVMTPGHLKIHSRGDMKITSDANMSIEAENLYLQKRLVNKEFGGSI